MFAKAKKAYLLAHPVKIGYLSGLDYEVSGLNLKYCDAAWDAVLVYLLSSIS